MKKLRTQLPELDWSLFLTESDQLLSKKEKRIVSLRHGYADGKYHTLQELGNEFGVTRERIRQIESVAAQKVLAAIH